MPPDPDVRSLIERCEAMGMRPYDELSVTGARRVVESSTWMQGERVDVAAVRDVLVPGADGRLPARVYHPEPDVARPLLVYFHGGGWVAGSIAVADRPCRALAAASGCVVASVGYRLAPETPFPGPAEDCYTALSWLAEQAVHLGADPGCIAVAGDSAGANLAAATALMARDRGGPDLAHQVLLYPPLTRDGRQPSATDNAEGYLLTGGSVDWFWEHYLPSDGAARHPYAAPLCATDLRGVAPATVVTAEFDPLRDEGNAYAARLRDDGVAVRLLQRAGTIHGLFWMAGELASGRELIAVLGAELRSVLTRETA